LTVPDIYIRLVREISVLGFTVDSHNKWTDIFSLNETK
jgi:hypothetical protein